MIRNLKDAIAVLLGKAKASAIKSKPEIKFRNEEYSVEEQEWLNTIDIEFLFAEFGEERTNGGGASFDEENRLNPSLKTLKQYFPKAKYTVYSDFVLEVEGVELIKVASPVINRNHPRDGYRTADYYKFMALINSKSDFKCILNSDMQIVSLDIIALIYLTQKFGFCVPYNDRQLLRYDMQISKDTQLIVDDSKGLGQSYNQSPMTLWKNNERGQLFYTTCVDIMKNDPSRASLVMWKAAWQTGVYPYILPNNGAFAKAMKG